VRIAIVGSTGAGKTTLARQLAARLGLRHVELDALHWEPNWIEAPQAVFLRRVAETLAEDGWVADGNYGRIAWERAETVIWLDYPFALTAWRLLRRTIRRAITREELWNRNREPVLRSFTRESVFLWLVHFYRRRRHEYAAIIGEPLPGGMIVVRLRSPAETRTWLATLPPRACRLSEP